MDDVRVRTNAGALITLVSFTLIAFLTLGELVDYRKVHEHTSLVVDKSRGEKLTIGMNITFPRVPCYRECHQREPRSIVDSSEPTFHAVLSVDIMDISGESQFNIMHEVERTRLHANGQPVYLGTVQGECV
jgi:hypothetical protein